MCPVRSVRNCRVLHGRLELSEVLRAIADPAFAEIFDRAIATVAFDELAQFDFREIVLGTFVANRRGGMLVADACPASFPAARLPTRVDS